MEIVKKHVQYLKKLDDSGKLLLCGPFTDYDGGMVVLECRNIEEARAFAESDPFIEEGYKTFELRTLSIANKENNYRYIAGLISRRAHRRSEERL